jgi:hypothetical protein
MCCGRRRHATNTNAFAQVLRDRGVEVHHFDTLLAQTLQIAEARAFVMERVCTPELVGPTLVGLLRDLAENLDVATLAELLIGGITRSDLSPLRVRSLRWQTLNLDDFVLAPLPNTLFQRDNSAWVYGGVTINPMARPPGDASRCTAAPCTGSTRCSPTPRSPSTTATTTSITSPPPSKAATFTCWAEASC